MRKMIAALLCVLMLLSLTACGGGGSGGTGGSTTPGNSETPPGGYDKEFTIYVNGSDEWTPFAGKSGVSFSVSDDKSISVSNNGTKVEFTGKQVGESTITATLDETESKALVRVRAMAGGDKKEDEEKTPVPLILELPGSFYVEYDLGEDETGVTNCLTEDAYSHQYADEDGVRCIDYFTPSGSYYYWEAYGWIDTTDDGGWTSGKFANWSTKGTAPYFYDPLCDFRMVIEELGASAMNDISQYDTGESEIIADVACEIYKIHSHTYWVEPTYHFCLKYVGDDYAYTALYYLAPYDHDNLIDLPSGEQIHKGN